MWLHRIQRNQCLEPERQNLPSYSQSHNNSSSIGAFCPLTGLERHRTKKVAAPAARRTSSFCCSLFFSCLLWTLPPICSFPSLLCVLSAQQRRNCWSMHTVRTWACLTLTVLLYCTTIANTVHKLLSVQAAFLRATAAAVGALPISHSTVESYCTLYVARRGRNSRECVSLF